MYAVVTLRDSDEVMVVPSNWLNEDKKECYWPPFKSTVKCLEAVQNRYNPAKGDKPWEKLAILFHSEHGNSYYFNFCLNLACNFYHFLLKLSYKAEDMTLYLNFQYIYII